MSSASDHPIPSIVGGPTWEVARLFPQQGRWRESDYFAIHTNQMVELVDGNFEILPMPTWLHQLMVRYLSRRLEDCVEAKFGGRALSAPLPVRLFPGTIREPDVLYCSPANVPSDPRGYPIKVDLVMEIVSEGDAARKRDYEDKRADYAKAGVAEYWIVDPEKQTVSVLTIENGAYSSTVFGANKLAQSRLYLSLTIDVSELFALAETNTEPNS